MKDPLKRAIFGLMLFSGICPAKDFSIDFNPISPYTPIPRLLYAFSARNQVDRYNLQAMRQGLGVKRPDDPPATSRMLDSLLNLFKGYDTAATYDSLKKKDDFWPTAASTALIPFSCAGRGPSSITAKPGSVLMRFSKSPTRAICFSS
jgi:hypothetical protein